MKKILNILLCVLLCISMLCPVVAFGVEAKKTISLYTKKTYTHNVKFNDREILQGLDLSYHNGDLDWNKIKAAGTNFVILRAGYRGYGESGTLVKDTKFDEYIAAAKKQKIPVGAYIYSQAINTKEAIAEADFILNIVKGYKLDLPIVFDYEFAEVSTGRLDRRWNNGTITKKHMTDNVLAFCDRVKKAGYTPMLYSNKDFMYNKYETSLIEKAGIKVWLAHYVSNSTLSSDYKGNYEYWQYSASGTISGLSGKVFDSNFWYKSKDDNSAQNPDSTTTTPAPAQVKNVKATINSKSSVTVQWDAVNGALGYCVEMKNGDKYVEYDFSNTNSYTFENLDAKSYTVRVKAYKISNSVLLYGTASTGVSFSTNLAKPTTSYSSTADTLTLKWTKVSGASGYKIYKYNYTTKKYSLLKTITSPSTVSTTFKSLNTNAKYGYKMVAYKTLPNGNLLYSDYTKGMTCYTKPRTPIYKSAALVSSKTVKVKWAKTSEVDKYEIMWSTTSDFSSNKKSVVVGKDIRSKNIKTYHNKKNYYFRVRSYKIRNNTKYYSAWSPAKKVYISK